MRGGKHVFVEKPLAIKPEELQEIEASYVESRGILMVGFNRRFAPQVLKVKHLHERRNDKLAVVCTVNAGKIPADHWTQDPEVGGGRIIGEACHFIDLIRFLVGAPVNSVHTTRVSADTLTISLSYADGSMGTLHYLANGSKSFPKERVAAFVDAIMTGTDNSVSTG